MSLVTYGDGTADDPWQLETPSGTSTYTAWRDETAEPPALVVQVGTTRLSYQLRALDDLHAMLREQCCTRLIRLLPMLLQPRLQQIILDRHATKNLPVGIRLAIVAVQHRRQHLADLQPAPRSHDHPAVSWIAHGIDRPKAAHLPHRPHANQVMSRH